MHDEMTQEQASRISAYLATIGSTIDLQPKRRIRQLIKIDTAIQSRLAKYEQIQDLRKSAIINISVISADTQISRKTFYNDGHFLSNFVEMFAVKDTEKDVSENQYRQLKDQYTDLEIKFKKMLLRDIDMAELRHTIMKLQSELETYANLAARYEKELERLKEENMALKEQASILNPSKVIRFPSGNLQLEEKRKGNDPDIFTLGITYGTIDDLPGSLSVADACGTHTVMVYCDNEYFSLPKGFADRDYRIVVHGPVNTNISSHDEVKRRNSVNRLLAIIAKLNRYKNRISAFVIHPGSAVNDLYLIDSLKEILSKSEITIAVENMAGQGKQLLSTFDEMKGLYDALQDYDCFSFCIDTCHLNDAGYDVNDAEHIVSTLTRTIPTSRISVIHLNDSKNPRGSRKDRHAVIGHGTIKVQALQYILKHPSFYDIPKVLESPQTEDELSFPAEMNLLLKEDATNE